MVGLPNTSRKPGFLRVELLVLMVIVSVLIASAVVAVHKTRGEAARTQCINNLKQIGLGLHNFESTFKRLPPLFGGGTDPAGNQVTILSAKFPTINGTPHVFLLPNIESDRLFSSMWVKSVHPHTYVPSQKQTNQKPNSSYICPADPGYKNGIQAGSPFGGTSYAANGQLFGNTKSDGPGATGEPSDKDPWDRALSIARIPDGSSNTIAFAHTYTRCGGVAGDPTTPANGTVWGYYNNGLPPPAFPNGNQGPAIFMNSLLSGSANVGPGIKVAFQNRPAPHHAAFNGSTGCDPGLPATPHRDAMTVLLADGTVRNVTPSISLSTWWFACSPDDGKNVPSRWCNGGN